VDALLGSLPTGGENEDLGPKNHAALKCFLEYIDVCNRHGVVFASLDEVLVGWARWCIDARELFKTQQEADAWVKTRQEKAGKDGRLRSMPVSSFRTYVNAVSNIYKALAPVFAIIVPSSVSQFPQFNALMRPLVTHERAKKAQEAKGGLANNVLQADELLTVLKAAEGNTPFFVQRRNLLLLGYTTSYRGEVLRRLVVESFKPEFFEGRKSYSIVVGTMKNLPGDLNHVDHKPFSLLITSGDDPRTCPIRAIDRDRWPF
jgi:hypothetical protein